MAQIDQNPNSAWKQEITFDWENLDHAASFQHWKKEFGKTYDSLEQEGRAFITFLDNWKMINDFNIADERSFTLRMNQFSDLNADDFQVYVHGHKGSCLKKRSVQQRAMKPVTAQKTSTTPDAVDWTNVNGKSYVTPVKNQGQCGSCWAFSTTGSIESRTAIANGQTDDAIVSLSEKQLIDCSVSYGNYGCQGGWMDDAFKYVIASGGLCSEEEYPYSPTDTERCKAKACGTKYDAISSYTNVTADSETSLEAAVTEGPVSIAIDAGSSAFQFYSGGVVDGSCGDYLNHGVLVVGYGTDSDSGKKFWKVKNSWGDSWGEDGYVLLCRDCYANDGAGECGILMMPSFPVIANTSQTKA
eukprot:507833_1